MLPNFIRFRDLKERQIVNSWPQLGRMIRDEAFPRGKMLGPNTRAWSEQEIADWLASRPEGKQPHIGNERRDGESAA
jgi:predicted DNA-binding transcriptional regulator AlpA